MVGGRKIKLPNERRQGSTAATVSKYPLLIIAQLLKNRDRRLAI